MTARTKNRWLALGFWVMGLVTVWDAVDGRWALALFGLVAMLIFDQLRKEDES